MDDKKEHIIYTKADIDNYLQGKMSKEAMHSLERAALQDPFLADAIEGFALVDTAIANKDLADIQAMILADKQPTKVVEMAKSRNGWLKIAVAVMLFAGAGWIGILLMNKGNNPKSIVSNEKQPVIENQNTKIATDSVIPKGAIASVEQKNIKQQFQSLDANAVKADSSTEYYSNAKVNNAPALYAATEPSKNDGSKAAYQWNANANVSATSQTIASNKAAGPSLSNNATGYTLSNSNATASAAKEVDASALEDRSFVFAAKAKDKYDADKSAKAIASDKNTITLPTIRIKRDSTVESVPITGYFSKKEAAKPFYYKLSKEDSLTVPVNGWAAFNEYLRQNNAYTTITYDTAFTPVTIVNNKTGEEVVALEFDIDKFGNPDKIKVTKSVDEQTDAKAIELLKNGPKWQASNKKSKGKVSIKF